MARRENVLKETLKIVNVGLQSFAEDLKSQGVEVVHVDWQPPAGGDVEMLRLLERLGLG